jgi:hypothetical protein
MASFGARAPSGVVAWFPQQTCGVSLEYGRTLSPPYASDAILAKSEVLETDRVRLADLIPAEYAAIDARIVRLKQDGGSSAEERQAIDDALAGLRVLRREAGSN